MVESGNGRILALGRVYDNKGLKLVDYKNTLKQWAAMYGLDPAKVDTMKRPIMIRRRTTDLDRETRVFFTQRSNSDEIARMPADEVALADSALIDAEIVRLLNDTDIDHSSNSAFVNEVFDRLPAAERKALTTDGRINPAGVDRIENALLAMAYHRPGKPEFLKAMITFEGDDFKQISNALKNVARRWVYMKGKMRSGDFIDADPTENLVDAIYMFIQAKRDLKGGKQSFRDSLKDYVKTLRLQHGMNPEFEYNASTVLFLDFLSVADTQKKLEAGLRAFIDDVEANPPGQAGFFEAPTMESILDRTIGAHRTEAKVEAQTAETPSRPPEKIKEKVEEEQIHAQDEEVDYRTREEDPEDIEIEESAYGEQGPSDAELDALEAQADAELANDPTWNADKELAEIRELENIGDAMAEDSPMMNCILGKL